MGLLRYLTTLLLLGSSLFAEIDGQKATSVPLRQIAMGLEELAPRVRKVREALGARRARDGAKPLREFGAIVPGGEPVVL